MKALAYGFTALLLLVLIICKWGINMAKRNTKDIILFESLKLFADKGYDGVTVRDIAAEVGIKQSSLYKHYKSKQEIFDTLVDAIPL